MPLYPVRLSKGSGSEIRSKKEPGLMEKLLRTGKTGIPGLTILEKKITVVREEYIKVARTSRKQPKQPKTAKATENSQSNRKQPKQPKTANE